MDNSKNKNLEESLQKKFSDVEMEVDPKIWENVIENLDEPKVVPIGGTPSYIKYMAAASIIFAAVITTLVFMRKDNDLSDKNSVPVANSVEKIEKDQPEIIKVTEDSVTNTVKDPVPVDTKVIENNKIFRPEKKSDLIVYQSTAEKKEILLPDGSRVTLNKNSKLRLMNFSANTREVALIGEAYFEVASDKNRPFKISCGNSMTEVLGTSFNINQVNEDSVELLVVEGRVRFSALNMPENTMILTANEYATCFNNHLEVIDNINTNYLSWKTDKLIFASAPLSEVIKTLEGNYDVKIEVEDPSVLACHFNGTFKKANPKKVINTLSIMLNLSVETEGNTFYLKGTGCN